MGYEILYVFCSFFSPLLQLRMATSAIFLEHRHCLVRHSCRHGNPELSGGHEMRKQTARSLNLTVVRSGGKTSGHISRLLQTVSVCHRTLFTSRNYWMGHCAQAYFPEPTQTLSEATSCLPVLKVLPILEGLLVLRVLPVQKKVQVVARSQTK